MASAAAGAVVTTATRNAPGVLLGLLVVAGTVAAALAIRPGAGRMILPAPVLSYLAAALTSGIIHDRSDDMSNTALAIAATQWIADGFFAMALATVLAAAITVARWYLWRRRTRTARDQDWPVPAAGAAPPPGTGRDTTAEAAYPSGFASQRGRRDGGPAGGWGGATARGPRPRSSRRGSDPGPGPYNFSSGA